MTHSKRFFVSTLMMYFFSTLTLAQAPAAGTFTSVSTVGSGGGTITLFGSTSGSVTLTAPAVAGATTLTLPATNTTLATTSGIVTPNNCAKFDSSGNLVDAGAPCGTGGGGGNNSAGTTGTFPLFTGPNSLGNSAMTQNGNVISFGGNGFLTGHSVYGGLILTDTDGQGVKIWPAGDPLFSFEIFNSNSAGVIKIGDITAAPQGGAMATPFIANSIIYPGQLVKLDLVGNGTVVAVSGQDSGVPWVPIVGVATSYASQGQALYVAVSGVMAMSLGYEGPCAVGQWVMPSAIGWGNVKCTSVYSAGQMVGRAISSQTNYEYGVFVLFNPR